tara:strand:- start:13756 stop:13947 length:192 start_codon:yes stop_codon:yes gene_type:complete
LETESIFADFDFKKSGGNSNFRLLKELLIAQEKLEQKIRVINTEFFELQQHIDEMKEKVATNK